MKWNRKLAALGVLSLIMTMMAALALITDPPDASGANSEPEAGVLAASEDVLDESLSDEEPEPAAKQYLLKDFSGYIGIYDPEDLENPKTVTKIMTEKLRSADARMLKEGILVTGEDELARLLEDFGS